MNKRQSFFLSSRPNWGALQIAGAYLLIGGLWILFSDQLAARIALSQEMLTVISLYKGWGYVLVTALLLYWLIQRHTAAVHASKEQLHQLIDAMPVFISYVDAKRHYQFSNRTYKEWFDDQVDGKHIEEVIGKAAYRTVSKYVDRALSGEITTYEAEVPYQDQELFMTATYIPDKAADGQVKGFFVMAQDRTAQRQSEEEHRLWADAFEGCAHGLAIADPNTNRIVVCNPAFAGLHKSRTEDIVGSAILSLYAASDHEHVRRNIEKADQIGHVRFEAHMTRRGKDGSTFPVQMDIVSVLGEDGELMHRVVTAQDITERKQAEENVRASEERYRHLFENHPHPMWTYDRKTLAFLDVNEAAIEKYGYLRSEFLRMTIRDIRPAEDVERLREHLRHDRPALLHSGGWRHRLKDGSLIDVEITSHTVEIDGREAVLVVAQDITERKRVEEQVKESEAKYRTLVEHLPAITYISHADEYVGVSYISSQIESLGFDRSTWVADPELWIRSIHPDDRKSVDAELQRFQDGAEVFRAEYRLMLPNGESRWFHDESIRVKGQDGRTILKQGFMLDITERKQAEEKILQQAAWLDQINDAVITCDKNLLITGWNPAAERVYGWKAEEVLGKKGEEVLASEFFSKTPPEVIQELSESGEFSAEIIQSRKDGSRIEIETRTVILHDERGQAIGYVSVNRDITERKRAEEASKSLARFPEENPNPVLRATHEGKIIYANASSQPLLTDWDAKVGDYLPADWIQLIGELTKTRSKKTIEAQCGERTYSVMIAYAPNANDVNIYGRDITERIKAEAAALDSKLRYQRVLDTMMEGCQIIGFDWRYLYVNPVVAEQGKRKPEELLGRTMMEVYPGIENTELFVVLRQCMEERVFKRIENKFVFPDGGVSWFELSIQPVEEGIFLLSTDISERKQAEEYLRRFELLSAHSRDIILFMGRQDGRILEANTAAVQAYGYSREELLSLTIWDLRASDTLNLTADQMAQAEAGGILFETNHQRKDGSTFPVEVSSKGANIGGVRTLISIVRDITERKRIEKDLQAAHDELELKVQQRTADLSEANALLQALMDNMPDHIYFKDLQSRFIRTSRSQAMLLGLNDPAKAIGKTDFDFFPHAARSYAEEQEVMRSGKPLIDLEEWVVWPDGRDTWVTTTKMPLRNARGETIGIFGISHDITRRKRTEQEIKQLNTDLEKQAEKLQAANKELEAFSYSVSHDLRAPLRAIDGYTRILMEDYEPILDAEGTRICGIIGREARRMGQLIDDLLAFSRLGRKEMYTSEIDMRGMVVSILNELLKEEERTRLDFQIGKLPEARGDSSLIRQVWFNLLANAIKFTSKKEQAVIEIGSKTNKDELIYYVRDSGAGFEMDYANKLFGVFQRLHSDSEFDGTGVGLAIVQRIIHRHEGRVWAEGEVEKGATFYFALPRKEKHHE